MKRFIITTICICIAIVCMTINLLTGDTDGILVSGFSLIALCINGVQLTLLAEKIAKTERKIRKIKGCFPKIDMSKLKTTPSGQVIKDTEVTCND